MNDCMALPVQTGKAIAVTAALVVIACLFFGGVWYIARNKPVPKERKLADIAGQTLETVVAWPRAEPWSYQMVLGLQRGSIQVSVTNACPELNGSVRIFRQGDPVAEFPISSRDAMRCNWLSRDAGLEGFILTWSRTNLFSKLAPKTLYQVTVSFDRRVPQGSSMWLCYLQSAAQSE